MSQSNWYSLKEIHELGIRTLGTDVFVDRSVRFFGAEHISLGNRVRIDCFAMISASEHGVTLGSHVHIASGAYLFGSGGEIHFEDFSCVSSRVSLYTVSDDFVEGHLTNPTVPEEYRRVRRGPVRLGRHALVGSGSVVLPGVTMEYGAAAGALTLVKKSVPACAIVAGNPAIVLRKRRSRELLQEREGSYLRSLSGKTSL